MSSLATIEDGRVFATSVDTLYQHTRRVLLANMANALIVGAILWGRSASETIIAWWIAMATMVLVRIYSAYSFKRRAVQSSSSTWAARFTLGSLVAGVIWGGGAAALFPLHDGPAQVLLAFVIGGMAAGASSSVASYLPAFYAFLLPAMLPLALRFAIVGDKFHIGMAVMLGLFTALVAAIGRTTHRTLIDSYRLRYSNEDLVSQLQDARATLEQRVADRTQSLQEESQARGDAEKQLQHAQRLEAVGRLTGGVAHDFNNLLTVVVNSLELLEANSNDQETQELVRPALDAALRGGELTRSLLAFSRRQDLRPEVIDVYEAVQRLVTTILRRVLPESIEVRVEPTRARPLARVDPAQLEAALLNLALNARDAMPSGGTLSVSVERRTLDDSDARLNAGDYVCVQVRDDGTGIDAETLERAFEPFFTTKGDQGSGLGLSMVYGFARQSGGFAALRSTPGDGTTATVFLPTYDGEERPLTRGRPVSLRGHGELVLVVEDEASVRALTVRSLRSLGYRTLEAADATEALRLIDANPDVQLVMTDVVMPGPLDGLALAKNVHKQRPDVALLIVSGYRESSVSSPGWPSLAKPYRRNELARGVRDALR